MVKNNGIPIEVKKPFETVYELKNEIPSFEEFMENYESDGSLDYDDLSGGSIDEVKGYGPCNFSNRYCSCRSGERWVSLHIACPVPGCKRNDNDTSYWRHKPDGNIVQMSSQARIQCTKSGGCWYPSHVKNWAFICSSHGGTPESTDETSYLSAVVMANQLKRLDRQLAVQLMQYLTENDWGN